MANVGPKRGNRSARWQVPWQVALAMLILAVPTATARRSDATYVTRATAAVTRIELQIITGNRTDAGTDGDVFLGLGGREFFVDSQGDVDDFERNSNRTYIFGSGANVNRPAENDPRSPWQVGLQLGRIPPVYLRFEPGGGGDWDVERVVVKAVLTDPPGATTTFGRLDGQEHLWLGERRGKFLYVY